LSPQKRGPPQRAPRSLFDLPLGDGAIWTITEEHVETKITDDREVVVTSVLPAWSAETTVDLDREDLGLPTAARVIKQALGLTNLSYEAKQAAAARHSAVGFEAPAVTGLAIAASAPQLRPGYRREATLRFGYPFRRGQQRPRSPAAPPCVERLARGARVLGLDQRAS
jgi:hypothetical protein